jgi:hypothetical protein
VSAAGLFLIGVPVAFNAAFAALAKRFDYPDVLRRPTREVLARFRDGGTSLQLLWWAFALTAVLLAPLVVLFAAALPDADPTLLSALMLCSLEFVGRGTGWTVAERLTPPAYVAWSLWLIATGLVLL